jgi:hypothetical protein
MATRSGNTPAHLGLVDVVGKWSREDGKTRKDLAKEKKQAEQEKQKATIRKAASLKKRMAEVDASDIMPKPQGMNKCQLQHTYGYVKLPLTIENIPGSDDSESEAVGKVVHDGTETKHVMMEEELEKEAPPKKKKKPSFCDAIRKYLDDEGNVLGSGGAFQHTNYMEITENPDGNDDLDEVVVSQWNNFDLIWCDTYKQCTSSFDLPPKSLPLLPSWLGTWDKNQAQWGGRTIWPPTLWQL